MEFRYIGTFIFAGILIFASCARNLNSTFDAHDKVKRTNIPKNIFKKEAHTFKYDELNGGNIDITYLGCGGFSINRNNKIVLIDPFFTNPGPLKGAGLIKMKTNTKMVELGLKAIPNFKKENVEAILVSHSHYDHLLDVPYVYDQYTEKTKIYCSQSSKNMINGVGSIFLDNIATLNYKTSSENAIGERYYIADSTIRITPIISDHAPHFKGIKMFKGDAKPKHKYETPLDRSRAAWWKEGQTYAFLIDFMNADSVQFRIYLQSSAANPQNGWLHSNLKAEHPINLALLGIASFDYVDHYPEALIDHLNPQKLVLCHWEDFFNKYDRDAPKRVRATKVHEAIRRVNLVYPYKHKNDTTEQFILPYPRATVTCKK